MTIDFDNPTPAPLNAHQAWMAVMEDVRAVSKDSENKHQKFFFRGIDATMNAVGPVFRKHGVSCVPSRIVEAKHRDFLGGRDGDKLHHEAIITVEWTVTGPDGSTFTGQTIGEASDMSDKATTQAMSVALRTFLLQGLTMPTDTEDPDEHTIERATPWVAAGWESQEKQTDAWEKLTTRAGALPDAEAQAALKAWLKEDGIKKSTITHDEALEFNRRLKEVEVALAAASDPKADGWKSAAERKRTYASLTERVGKLAAYESEVVIPWMEAEGINSEETFTKAQAEELLKMVTEAENLSATVKVDPS